MSLQETIQADSCSVFYTMVHSNIIMFIFEYVSNRSEFSRNKNENQETYSTGSNY